MGERFVISNYFRKIEFHLKDIAGCKGAGVMQPEIAWIHFVRDTEFGEKVKFMPLIRPYHLSHRRHPIVEYIDRLAARSRGTDISKTH